MTSATKKANWGASVFWILLTVSLMAHAHFTAPTSNIGSTDTGTASRTISNVK